MNSYEAATERLTQTLTAHELLDNLLETMGAADAIALLMTAIVAHDGRRKRKRQR